MSKQCFNIDPHHPHWRRAPAGVKTPGKSGWLECHGIADPNCPTCKGEGTIGGKTGFHYDYPGPCTTCLPNPGPRPDLAARKVDGMEVTGPLNPDGMTGHQGRAEGAPDHGDPGPPPSIDDIVSGRSLGRLLDRKGPSS